MTRPLVLIVEDSKTCSSHLAARLQAFPHRALVHIESTVEDARTWLQSQQRQGLVLAVLDVELPDGSGLDLLPLLEGVRVVVVTSNRDAVTARDGLTVIDKGPAWATQVEMVLVKARRP